MKLIVALCCGFLFWSGCASSRGPGASNASTEVIDMRGRRLSAADVKKCIAQSKAGDGAAAFALYSHYLLGEPNARLSQKYFNRALELEYPDALYMEAARIWSQQEHPDLDHVQKLARRAVELGYKDEKGLLTEVVAARESGVIPRESKFRLFPETPGKANTPTKP